MTLNCSIKETNIFTLPPECTIELQQRALPSSMGNKSSVTDVIVTGPFLETRIPLPLPAPPLQPWLSWFERLHLRA